MTNSPQGQEVVNQVTSLADHVDTIDRLAQLIENHGALVTFAIVMGFINFFLIFQIVRGKLVPYSVYKKAVDEADRLQQTMERERESYMSRLLSFMGGLKVEEQNTQEGREDEDDGKHT